MKSMYRRIIVVASVFVLVIVTVASFFSIRITMQEEQGALCEQLMQAARYAARSAKKEEDLDHIAALMGARVTRISLAGEVLYDSGGQSGYYLDQPDVIRAISAGAGEERSSRGVKRSPLSHSGSCVCPSVHANTSRCERPL